MSHANNTRKFCLLLELNYSWILIFSSTSVGTAANVFISEIFVLFMLLSCLEKFRGFLLPQTKSLYSIWGWEYWETNIWGNQLIAVSSSMYLNCELVCFISFLNWVELKINYFHKIPHWYHPKNSLPSLWKIMKAIRQANFTYL